MYGENINRDIIKKHLDNIDPIESNQNNIEEIPIVEMEDYDSSLVTRTLESLNFSQEHINIIHDATSAIKNTNKSDIAEKTNRAFEELVNKFNEKYKLDIKIDFTNFSTMLLDIVDSKNKKVYELYLSEFASRFRVVAQIKFMQAIAILSEQILDPNWLLSTSTTFEAKFIMVEKLFSFMTSIEMFYSEVNIKSSELELERINDLKEKVNLNNPKLDEFLDSLKPKD